MNQIEIRKAGLMTSIQDLGREGLAYYAIPKSGVMDENAAKIALLLFNKNEQTPLIECTCIAPEIKFYEATKIALTGANFNWKVNGNTVPLNTILDIQKGDILKGAFAKNGLRGYISFENDLKIEPVFDSYSTYTNAKIGGFQGRLLQKGDIIKWKKSIENDKEITIIPIRKAPEFDYLTEVAKQELVTNIYKIKPESNRMGARLAGSVLESSKYHLDYSLPVLPGFIQLPPNGLPIVVLQDGQTTGGYPRIAYIPEQFLSVFNQIILGGKLQFSYRYNL
ncbi:MAG: biotin-dependent carboxyltransferase family protein [Saprospiraceae bacterium]